MNQTELVENLRDWLEEQISRHQTFLDNDSKTILLPKLTEENRIRKQSTIDICTFRIKFFKEQLNNL